MLNQLNSEMREIQNLYVSTFNRCEWTNEGRRKNYERKYDKITHRLSLKLNRR